MGITSQTQICYTLKNVLYFYLDVYFIKVAHRLMDLKLNGTFKKVFFCFRLCLFPLGFSLIFVGAHFSILCWKLCLNL